MPEIISSLDSSLFSLGQIYHFLLRFTSAILAAYLVRTYGVLHGVVELLGY